MKVGLVYAMAEEIRSILAAYSLPQPVYHLGIPFYEVSDNIIAVAGGIGKVNIAAATALLCDKYDIDIVLNSGLAGGFKEYPIGTKVLIDRCVQHDVDTTAIGDELGLVSTVNIKDFYTYKPEYFADILRSLNIPFEIGCAASGDWFATGGERADRIAECFDPTVADMEAGAIAQICYRAKVDFIAIKSISDKLGSGKQADEFQVSLGDIVNDLNANVKKLVEVLIHEPKPEMEG